MWMHLTENRCEVPVVTEKEAEERAPCVPIDPGIGFEQWGEGGASCVFADCASQLRNNPHTVDSTTTLLTLRYNSTAFAAAGVDAKTFRGQCIAGLIGKFPFLRYSQSAPVCSFSRCSSHCASQSQCVCCTNDCLCAWACEAKVDPVAVRVICEVGFDSGLQLLQYFALSKEDPSVSPIVLALPDKVEASWWEHLTAQSARGRLHGLIRKLKFVRAATEGINVVIERQPERKKRYADGWIHFFLEKVLRYDAVEKAHAVCSRAFGTRMSSPRCVRSLTSSHTRCPTMASKTRLRSRHSGWLSRRAAGGR